ncbi:uncharacterized protein LOC112344590 [Selaginella moellendorffii]|uniref:uncharacterized protein LOC112344590 n=1 Tax=Selaginella moellendorffii TaxID=88036 RepID=UPI000D1CD6D2|nr:uncharacterized protein LOC112344590 [Selaginella moellendorffii]|eukprot:XP_024525397.1 uncharacterized protein LOC112344590 [Selaginella moellendorffii]
MSSFSLAQHRRLLLLLLRPRSARGVSSSCARLADDDEKKVSSRLFQRQQVMNAREEDALEEATGPPPKVTMDHVTMSFARSSGAGGQNVNKVNTKVDMRFKVMAAQWLPLRARLKLLQTVGHV